MRQNICVMAGEHTRSALLVDLSYIVLSNMSNVFLLHFNNKQPSYRLQTTKR